MKSRIKMILLCIWFSILSASLFFGPRGLWYGIQLQRENNQIRTSIQQLAQNIQKLEETIEHWQKYDFFKEQMAREQLQFARPNEMIYLINAH